MAEPARILLVGPHAVRQRAVLRANLKSPADIATWTADEGTDALAGRLAVAEIAVAMRWPGDMPPAPRLRLLQLPGGGYDGIDFAALPAGCAVCNVYEHEVGVAEYVLAAMLECGIGLAAMDRRFRAGSWDDSLLRYGPARGELMAKTVGLVGYGHIGRAVARRARAFDARVIAVTRSPRPPDDWAERIDGLDALDGLIAEADFLVVACALTPGTEGLIDGRRLGLMKPAATLINVARGPVVDEDALYAALAGRSIAGAVLDVWYLYPEPGAPDPRPSRHPFHALDNVVMTPHASAWTEGLIARRWTTIAANFDRYLAGRPLLNLVRPGTGGKSGGTNPT